MKQNLTIWLLCFCLCPASLLSQTLQNNAALVSLELFAGYKNELKENEAVLYYPGIVEVWMQEKKPLKAVLGYSQEDREIAAYYFPGSSNKKALVIGGMHGSELSAIEIAGQLLDLLSTGQLPYYNVVIIPSLFPDNAVKAMTASGKTDHNFGRYTSDESVDPNRQMPPLGKAFSKENPVDLDGRVIEKENQSLLQLVQDYQPSRIVNLHAIKNVSKAGIYADPRTDCNGYALGFETDSSLAISIASFIENTGGDVPGNSLQQKPNALYHYDPEIAAAGSLQKRNLHGSLLANNRGYGVSLGGWASTAVCDEAGKRDAARLITIEFPGYKPSFHYTGGERDRCALNIRLYATAIRNIFLEDVEAE